MLGVVPMEEARFLAATLGDTGSVHNALAVGARDECDKEIPWWHA
jgi:hypothetical protein